MAANSVILKLRYSINMQPVDYGRRGDLHRLAKHIAKYIHAHMYTHSHSHSHTHTHNYVGVHFKTQTLTVQR